MAALGIIAVYVALSMWILGVEWTHQAGKAMGWWNLADRSVLGLFLTESTQRRVGPKWLSGFGVEQTIPRRLDQADFLLKAAEDAISAAERAEAKEAGSGAATLAQAALAERRLADVSLAELKARRDAASKAFSALDASKGIQSASGKVTRALKAARELAEQIGGAEGGASEKPVSAKQRDDLAAAVEEVMFSVEDLQKRAPAGSLLKEIKTAPLQDAADEIREAKGKIEVPSAAFAAVQAAVDQVLQGDASGGGAGGVVQALGVIEPAIEKLFPMPTGGAGTLYRFRTLLGTDAQGRSILIRGLYSAKVALQVGVVVAFIAVMIGAFLGAAAAYYGGWIDTIVQWLYSMLSSVPQLVLLAVLAFMFLNSAVEGTLIPVYVALCLTFWIGPCRVIRGEVMKIKELEFAQAATVIGFSRQYILVKHVLPNTLHLMFINFSLLFIGAVKTEVILTFLGLGIKDGASWGLMISQAAPEVINGIFWQIGVATVLMLILVLAFNIVSDALQDAFDPKHVG